MTEVSLRSLIFIGLAWAISVAECGATPTPPPPAEPACQVLISVPDQRLAVVCDGQLVARYPVSTSRYGTGDRFGSYKTPLGALRVTDKIGANLAPGAVIKHRSATGEVLPVNAPGRDPIVTRVIWLDGLEAQNHNAHSRGIYIHGTPEERNIGTPASYGCIRMRSKDVIKVFDEVPVGTVVSIIPDKLPHLRRYEPPKEQPELPPALVAAPGTPAPAAKTDAKEKPAPIAQTSVKENEAAARPEAQEKPALIHVAMPGGKSDVSALRAMRGSILLANMPDGDHADDHRIAKSSGQ